MSRLKNLISHNRLYKLYKTLRGKYALLQYGDISKDMFVIGITGTNGKTTTSFLIHHIFNSLLGKTFLLGTNEIKYGTENHINTTKMTSPDVLEVYKYLALAKSKGCQIAVLETASHGLEQQRFYGINFDMALLTNITPEHLDYHKTMENYAKTKKKLFTNVINSPKANKMAVLPKDDKIGRERIDELAIEKTLSFGIASNATLRAQNIHYNLDTTNFDLNYMGSITSLSINLVGMHNVYNVLCALCAGFVVGLELKDMTQVLQSFVPPLGRMETLDQDGVRYYVDFAHTPDALEKTLSFLDTIKGKGRLLVLTGAMGQRDRFKRPQMGKIADKYADIIVLADEDPGEEPRWQIIQEIKEGIKRHDGDGLFIIPDRAKAIQFLTQIAQPGDLVMLAGKGHETVMSVPGGMIPWDEKGILKNYLDNGR